MRQSTSKRVDYYFACDDAGSAYHIAAFVSQKFDALINKRKCEFRLGGPALRVFKEFMNEQALSQLPQVEEISLETRIAIIGTGEGFERQEISNALELEIPVLAVFDNWTDFENRLLSNGQRLDVRSIIVTDDKALELSRRANSGIRTIKVDNYIIKYLSELKKSNTVQANNLLILHQPLKSSLKILKMKNIKTEKVQNIIRNDIDTMIRLMKEKVNYDEIENVTVRIHPTFSAKYESIMDLKDNDYQISKNTLLEDLSNSKIVAGLDTYGLYLSEKLNIKTIRLKINE